MVDATSSARSAGSHPKQLTPLWIISVFVSLTEVVLGVAVARTGGEIQFALVLFVTIFPVMVATAFFLTLWFRPYVLYSPSEYGKVDIRKYVSALTEARFSTVVKRTSDLNGQITVIGNPDQFKLLFKVSGGAWKKSTKALEVDGGCIVQVTTEQLNPDGSLTAAEAVAFVPGVAVESDSSGEGRHLRSIAR